MRLWAVVLMLVVMTGVAVAGTEADRAKAKRRIDVQMAAEDAGKMQFASASQLYREYEANEIAADAKYKGKWAEIDGTVLRVSRSFGKIFVELAAGQYGMARVQCKLFSVQIKINNAEKTWKTLTPADYAAQLKKGQKILINGRGNGARIGMPQLIDCLILPAK